MAIRSFPIIAASFYEQCEIFNKLISIDFSRPYGYSGPSVAIVGHAGFFEHLPRLATLDHVAIVGHVEFFEDLPWLAYSGPCGYNGLSVATICLIGFLKDLS